MKIAVETITPEMAAEWLTLNMVNRRIEPKRVEAYAYDMREGAWQLNGEAIRFNTTGKLIDGQHRLSAIASAGIPVTMVVMRDVSDDVSIYDRGRVRSTADAMIIDGMDKAIANNTTAAVAKLHYEIQGAGNVSSDYKVKQFIEKHEDSFYAVRPLITKGHNPNKSCLSTKYAPLVLASLYAYECGEQIADILEFGNVYKYGIVSNINQNAAIICRNDAIAYGFNKCGGAIRRRAELIYEKAIYDFCRKYPRAKTYKSVTEPTYSNNKKFSEK